MTLGTLSFRRAVVAVAALLLGAVSQAKADIIIDDFSVPGAPANYSLDAPVGSTFSRVDGNRTVLVTQIQNTANVAGRTTGFIGAGLYDLSTASNTTAFTSLAYTYSGLNLAAGGTILNFTFTSTDLNVPFSVIVGDGTSTSTQVGLVTSASNLSFDLSGFAGVNLSAITSIELVLNRNVVTNTSTTSADFQIANVTITTPPTNNAVPAPPAALLALAALPVLGLRRRLAKKA